MPEITNHKVNGLNEAISINTIDQPGPGGGYHDYEVRYADYQLLISFQNGPINEKGVNGISNEALLAIVEHRLQCFQAGEYRCLENETALVDVQQALSFLQQRTKSRVDRGVEGTSQV